MEVWREIVLILAVFGAFAFGFYVMAKLDKILDENRKSIEKESESCEPSCVMLTNILTEEEIIEEIRRFRSRHKETGILIFDSSHVEWEEDMECGMQQK